MDYGNAYNSLGSVYDPQVANVNSQVSNLDQTNTQQQAAIDAQIAGLAPQQAAQQASLDQAKVNAFKDITNSANSKGVLFSGVPIDQQSTYVGTKYLPAVANLQTSFNNQKTAFTNTKNSQLSAYQQQRTGLLGQINTIQAARSREAQGQVAAYQAAQLAAQKDAETQAYRQSQLGLGYARLGVSQSNAANTAATKAAALPSAAQVRSAIQQGLSSVAGKNGFVAPQDYAAGLKAWLGAGLPRAEYNKQYNSYRDPTNGYYDYAVKQAGL